MFFSILEHQKVAQTTARSILFIFLFFKLHFWGSNPENILVTSTLPVNSKECHSERFKRITFIQVITSENGNSKKFVLQSSNLTKITSKKYNAFVSYKLYGLLLTNQDPQNVETCNRTSVTCREHQLYKTKVVKRSFLQKLLRKADSMTSRRLFSIKMIHDSYKNNFLIRKFIGHAIMSIRIPDTNSLFSKTTVHLIVPLVTTFPYCYKIMFEIVIRRRILTLSLALIITADYDYGNPTPF